MRNVEIPNILKLSHHLCVSYTKICFGSDIYIRSQNDTNFKVKEFLEIDCQGHILKITQFYSYCPKESYYIEQRISNYFVNYMLISKCSFQTFDIKQLVLGLPQWLSGQESTFSAGMQRSGFSPWVGKVPWGRKWQTSPVTLPRRFNRQRSLAGYSPWGCKIIRHN